MDYWYYSQCCYTPTPNPHPPTPPEPTGPSGDCVGVSGAHVNENGELEIRLDDGSIVNAGAVVGPSGSTGEVGWTGASGIGFQAAQIDANGDLQLTTTNGEVWSCGSVVGPFLNPITSGHVMAYQVPDGVNIFTNTPGDFTMELTLPVNGKYIGEVFTISHDVVVNDLAVKATNTSMTQDLIVTKEAGGAAFIWNGHFWQLITTL